MGHPFNFVHTFQPRIFSYFHSCTLRFRAAIKLRRLYSRLKTHYVAGQMFPIDRGKTSPSPFRRAFKNTFGGRSVAEITIQYSTQSFFTAFKFTEVHSLSYFHTRTLTKVLQLLAK